MMANGRLGRADGPARTTVSCSARTATCSSSATAASNTSAGCRPATCTSTASSATSARASSATAGCSARRAWSWWWSPSTSRPARCWSGPTSSRAAGCTRPRRRTSSTRRATWCRDAVEAALRNGVRDVEALERDVRRAGGQVRQRAHSATADDRARRHGDLTVPRRVALPRRRSCSSSRRARSVLRRGRRRRRRARSRGSTGSTTRMAAVAAARGGEPALRRGLGHARARRCDRA